MRSLFLPLPLLLAPLVAPVIFASPAEAVAVLPPCCQAEGETHPPDRHPEEDEPPVLVGAKVRNPDERVLEASAEAPITVEAPLVDAIGVPLSAQRGVSEPAVVPVPMLTSELQALQGEDVGVNGPPCCRAEGETHPPDRDPEDEPPVLVGAKVENRIERALKVMAAELPLPNEAPLVNAIGIPLSSQRGVSEPVFRPAEPVSLAQGPGVDDHGEPCCMAAEPEDPSRTRVTVYAPWRWLDAMQANARTIALALLIVAAIGFLLRARRRRPGLEFEPLPAWRPLPDELPRPDAAPVPQPEPEVARAKARQLEPA